MPEPASGAVTQKPHCAVQPFRDRQSIASEGAVPGLGIIECMACQIDRRSQNRTPMYPESFYRKNRSKAQDDTVLRPTAVSSAAPYSALLHRHVEESPTVSELRWALDDREQQGSAQLDQSTSSLEVAELLAAITTKRAFRISARASS